MSCNNHRICLINENIAVQITFTEHINNVSLLLVYTLLFQMYQSGMMHFLLGSITQVILLQAIHT